MGGLNQFQQVRITPYSSENGMELSAVWCRVQRDSAIGSSRHLAAPQILIAISV